LNDYHLHSYLCKHGEGEIYEYVEAAIAKGLQEIGFAEHIPIPGLDDPDGRMLIDEFPIYLHDIREAQEKYPEITIRLGIEADYMPKYLDFLSEFLATYPFDFVIGSVHFIDDWDFTNPAHEHRTETFGVDNMYRAYYKLLAEAAENDLFDVIGHLDIPKKFGHRTTADLSDEIDHVLKTIKEHDLALDVNTSGKKKPVNEIFPSPEILEKAYSYDIPIVIGSDAHRPRDVGFYLPETYALVRKIGYTSTCIFEKRERQSVPIHEIHYSQSTIS